MANTLIQIKRSTSTNQPTGGSLSAGELAYSYASNVAFIGTSGGNDVSPIGGKFYVDKTNSAYDIAIAAFTTGNTGTTAGAAFDKANAANIVASSAFDKANSANLLAFNTGIGANAFAAATIAGANAAVGAGANAYSLSTFVRLTAPGQTITGDLAIVGNLTLSGNTVFIDATRLQIDDPLIYLAGNNYTSDIVDIGFIGNYVNATGQNVHTGLFRDHETKEYYLFHSYDQEPVNNHIDPVGNNFTIAVLNSAIRTSNLTLAGANLLVTLAGANIAIGAGANSFAAATIAGANIAIGAGANAFASATIAGANTEVGAGANAFATAAAAGANAYLLVTIAGANTAVGAGANAFAIAAAAGANAYLLATIAGANAAVGTGANTYLLATLAGANAAVGAGANAFATAFASNASNITSGTLLVAYGGTGRNTFANNGVLFGNTTSGIRVTTAGTEGQVLQASSQGTPLFAMLDGGSF